MSLEIETAHALSPFAFNVFSQCGEDGIIARIFDLIGTTNRFCFEVGAAYGKWMSNTRRLIDKGWSAILIERDDKLIGELMKLDDGERVQVVHDSIEVEGEKSLDYILFSHDCPQSPDLGVIDIDGDDYYVFNSLLKIKPRVLVVEYDPFCAEDFVPERGSGKQAGLQAVCTSGKGRGYVPVFKTNFNVIFVRSDCVDPLRTTETTPKPKSLRLNLGGATGPQLEGYEVVDRKVGKEIYPLAYPSGSCDEIRASHCLEHLSIRDGMEAVKDWARALKPGGVLKIAVPDFDKLIEAVNKENPDNWPIQRVIYGGQTDENDFHKSGYNREWLTHLMTDAGLVDIQPWVSEVQDCAALPVSLNLQGTKPQSPSKLPVPSIPKTVSVMTLPRLAWTCNMFSALEVAVARGLEFDKSEGVFWDQCVERILTGYVEQGTAEWVLVSDYDSVYTTRQFDALCRLMLEHPEADAIAPIQIKRDEDNILAGLIDPATGEQFPWGTKITTKHFEPDLVPVSWAHFGLTLIRTSALRKMAHPWCLPVPNEHGRWDEGRTDADIYFWRKFTAAGNKLYIAPHVPLFHAQVVYTVPDQDLKPRHMYPSDYNKLKNNLPDWVRK